MPDSFSLGLITTSGSLGLLFPPSLPLIIYAIVSKTPVDQLFIAGIAPGILLITALSAYSFLQGKHIVPLQRHGGVDQLPKAFIDCSSELLLPVVILGGIYGGVIALSEAAALSTLYVLIVEVLIRREIPIGKLPTIIRDSMVLFGGILVVMATAMAYTSYLIDAEIPAQLLRWIQTHIDNRWLFLILLNLFLLAVGCMIDMFSALILVVPLILPIAQAYDVHPIHLGIIFLTNLEIGYSTPPVGLNLFIASIRFERPIFDLYRASIPFILILLICLALITYVPAISLFMVD
jgi:tripartite ATP-independent transporter DctM subunit